MARRTHGVIRESPRIQGHVAFRARQWELWYPECMGSSGESRTTLSDSVWSWPPLGSPGSPDGQCLASSAWLRLSLLLTCTTLERMCWTCEKCLVKSQVARRSVRVGWSS
jgi:hypothetical protein